MTVAVYEVEIATIPGHRLLQHVKAESEQEAQDFVQAAQGPEAKIIGVSIWRECSDKEATAFTAAKAQVTP